MSKQLDILELIQIFNLKKQGISTYNDRYLELSSKYTIEDVKEYSASTAIQIEAEMESLRCQNPSENKNSLYIVHNRQDFIKNKPALRLLK